ncbi:unnamed protein product [Brassica napus]|uniref:(rape) hypothetical protein n=2 Tax=Brassica TaxID=3705 RepID=A0A816J2F6_BRANA|nr:unnamed protein product [Brassica napus]
MKKDVAITILRLMMISDLLVVTTPFGVVAGEKEVVLDSNGNPVKSTALYFLKVQSPERTSWISRYGSGILSFDPCPKRVVSAPAGIMNPPEAFAFDLSSDVVRVSTELNIRSVLMPPICRETGYWRVEDRSSSTKAVVLTGSKSSNDSTFTIMKSSDGLYKISFGGVDKPKELGLEKLDDRGTWVLGLDRLWFSFWNNSDPPLLCPDSPFHGSWVWTDSGSSIIV